MFYTEVAALEDVLEEAVYALGTDARTILVQIRKCACGAGGGPSCSRKPPFCQMPSHRLSLACLIVPSIWL